ncbi:hypothetical protein N9L35_02410 [Alphaproteobacteria bacterium]|nr:hypothetical protein [Alphaproteobacteria bacterium]
MSFITIFLALGLCNANGTTLYCEGVDLYIHKNGPTIEVASKPSAGLEVAVSKVKLLSTVPELTFQAVLSVRDSRNICVCEKQYAIQKSVSLFKNRFDNYDANYTVSKFKSKHTGTDEKKLDAHNSLACLRQLRSLDAKASVAAMYGDESFAYLNRKISSFKPLFNCRTAPFKHLEEAEQHFNELLDTDYGELIKKAGVPEYCHKTCNTHDPEKKKYSYCVLTDLQ